MNYFVCAPDGPKLRTDRDAADVIAEALPFEWIVIPVERLDTDFFRLRTGVAGQIVQKFVNYRRRVAIVGDVSQYVNASPAFRDFVLEANRGTDLNFIENIESLRFATHKS